MSDFSWNGDDSDSIVLGWQPRTACYSTKGAGRNGSKTARGSRMSSQAEAARLAAIIRAYWRRQGLSPALRIEQEQATASPTAPGTLLWVVRRNMVGGLPCKAANAAAHAPSFGSGLVRNPPSPFMPSAAIRQRTGANESVRASKAVWGGSAVGHV